MDQKARFIQKAVRDTLLQRLLKGRAREVEALPELLREFGVCFRSDRFAVLGLRLCGPVPQGGGWRPPPEPDIHGIARAFLTDAPGWDAWELFQDDMFFAVLCRNGAMGASPLDLGQQLVQRLSPLHGISVAVSREKQGLGGLNDGYYEVLEVLGIIDMQRIENRALSYDQLDAATYQQMDTTFERDRRLINSVLEGDRKKLLEALAIQAASRGSGQPGTP